MASVGEIAYQKRRPPALLTPNGHRQRIKLVAYNFNTPISPSSATPTPVARASRTALGASRKAGGGNSKTAPYPSSIASPATCEEAWRAYVEAMEPLYGAGYKGDGAIVAAVVAAANLLDCYNAASNWRDGAPIWALPRRFTAQIALDLKRIARGHVPTWIDHSRGHGRPKIDPRQEQVIAWALSFKRFCDAGLINEAHPVKVIIEKYGVTRRAVELWGKGHRFEASTDEAWAEIKERFDPPLTDEECAKLVLVKLDQYGAEYRAWKRGPGGRTRPRRRRQRNAK
jgi:hypothetical protein